MDYKKYIRKQTDNHRAQGFERTFTPVYRYKDTFPFTRIDFNGVNKTVEKVHHNTNTTIWCSNDYLNMSHNPDVISRMIEVIKTVGTGSGGTRNISGSTPYHNKLEKDIAEFHGRERALIFSSAYIANQATLSTLCKRLDNVIVFSDQLNHASLIEGIKNSKVDCSIFKHNDVDHLESLLRECDINRPKIIVFESLYSMDGTKTNVDDYVELAKKYNALTYLDEVHAIGLYGENGRGVANECGISKEVDIINGTLAKGFGQIGGYITGDEYLINFIKSFAPGFIFTTSMMPAIAAASSKSIEIVKTLDEDRKQIFLKAEYIKRQLSACGIPFIDSQSHIIPVLCFDEERVKQYSKRLLDDFNIYIQPIFYPTVPKGSARLRITVTPKHSIKDIDSLVEALKVTIKKNQEKSRDSVLQPSMNF